MDYWMVYMSAGRQVRLTLRPVTVVICWCICKMAWKHACALGAICASQKRGRQVKMWWYAVHDPSLRKGRTCAVLESVLVPPSIQLSRQSRKTGLARRSKHCKHMHADACRQPKLGHDIIAACQNCIPRSAQLTCKKIHSGRHVHTHRRVHIFSYMPITVQRHVRTSACLLTTAHQRALRIELVKHVHYKSHR